MKSCAERTKFFARKRPFPQRRSSIAGSSSAFGVDRGDPLGVGPISGHCGKPVFRSLRGVAELLDGAVVALRASRGTKRRWNRHLVGTAVTGSARVPGHSAPIRASRVRRLAGVLLRGSRRRAWCRWTWCDVLRHLEVHAGHLWHDRPNGNWCHCLGSDHGNCRRRGNRCLLRGNCCSGRGSRGCCGSSR